jgi:hypothetical protein
MLCDKCKGYGRVGYNYYAVEPLDQFPVCADCNGSGLAHCCEGEVTQDGVQVLSCRPPDLPTEEPVPSPVRNGSCATGYFGDDYEEPSGIFIRSGS